MKWDVRDALGKYRSMMEADAEVKKEKTDAADTWLKRMEAIEIEAAEARFTTSMRELEADSTRRNPNLNITMKISEGVSFNGLREGTAEASRRLAKQAKENDSESLLRPSFLFDAIEKQQGTVVNQVRASVNELERNLPKIEIVDGMPFVDGVRRPDLNVEMRREMMGPYMRGDRVTRLPGPAAIYVDGRRIGTAADVGFTITTTTSTMPGQLLSIPPIGPPVAKKKVIELETEPTTTMCFGCMSGDCATCAEGSKINRASTAET